MATRLYDVNVDNAPMAAILEWCLARGADTMLFVVRMPSESSATEPARKIFAGRVREEFMAYGWPGTKSLKEDNLILELDFDADLARLVADTGPRVADWREHNTLPEDPCVFKRSDCGPTGWPMLYSVTPEEVAWMVSDSRVDVEGVSPSLDPLTRQFIYEERSFCRLEEW